MIGMQARRKQMIGNHCYSCGMDDCIEFEGYCPPSKGAPRGYGRKKKQGKVWLAHRLAWTEANGDIPDGLTVDHICENTRCVNVEHLQLLTLADNIRKRKIPQREATACRNGHEYTEANTYWYGKERRCRTCHRARQQRYVKQKVGQ